MEKGFDALHSDHSVVSCAGHLDKPVIALNKPVKSPCGKQPICQSMLLTDGLNGKGASG